MEERWEVSFTIPEMRDRGFYTFNKGSNLLHRLKTRRNKSEPKKGRWVDKSHNTKHNKSFIIQ